MLDVWIDWIERTESVVRFYIQSFGHSDNNNNNNTQICTRQCLINQLNMNIKYELQSIISLNNKSIAESKAQKVARVLQRSKIKCFQITFECCKSWGKPNRQRE